MNKLLFYLLIIIFLITTILIGISIDNNYKISYIKGDSMGNNYDNIVLLKTDIKFNELKSGDIITFKDKCGNTIHHRLLYINSTDNYYTKGDNNNIYDFDKCYYNPIKPNKFNKKIIGKKIFGI